jgi:serine protease AprX
VDEHGSVQVRGPVDIAQLQALPFVESVKIVKNPVSKGMHIDKLSTEIMSDDFSPYLNPLIMVKGDIIHGTGYYGWGKLIAVLDGGFLDFDKLTAFDNLRNRKGVTGTYDFVEKNNYVYDYHVHGSFVMCVLAGDYSENVMGETKYFYGLDGSANVADYLLLRTEDTFSEYPAEEDFWAAGAEYAYSAGCDIISSSLGYFQFDDQSLNHKYSELDGKTVFVTRAAEAAYSRGIVVVNSAGNERATSWGHIIAPSDGENIIAVGAVDELETITTFSSTGPSSDGRIKPDVVAQGVYIPVQIMVAEGDVQGPELSFISGGTSFSCPMISGMAACLMQAEPKATASEIVSAIRAASDRFNSPDNDYGFGIPDMAKAVTILQKEYVIEPSGELAVGPNPFTDHLNITFRESPEKLKVELFNSFGMRVWYRDYNTFISLTKTINIDQNLSPGLYFIKITSSHDTYTYKLIKAGG